MTTLTVDEAELRQICAPYGISELLVVGSAARGEELAELFGRPVDLVAKRYLNPLPRDSVLAESRPLYAA